MNVCNCAVVSRIFNVLLRLMSELIEGSIRIVKAI